MMRRVGINIEIAHKILTYIEKHGTPPKSKDLIREFGYAARNSLHGRMTALRDAGIITWEPGKPQTLQVLQPDRVRKEYAEYMKKQKEFYAESQYV